MSFETRAVVVTGAAGNLGRAVANAFADLGARLVLIVGVISSIAVFGS